MSDMRRREFITLLSGFVVATTPDPVCMKRRIGRRRAPLRFVKLKPGHKATSEELVAPINNPTHWRQRAEKARELAS